MPADLSALFDTLLVLAGLVLILTGLVMFIRSKTSTQASSVEAFGIKLNVTHPSLILVLAGVGLMLAPRLLPELPGKAVKPESAVTTEAHTLQPAESSISATPAPAEPSRATQTARTVDETPVQPPAKPAVVPPGAPQPSAASVRPTQPPAPTTAPVIVETPVRSPAKPAGIPPAASPPSVASIRPAKPEKSPVAPPKKPVQNSSTSRPVAKPASAATAAAPDATVSPAAAAKPVRQTIAYAALGLPINRSFWSGETRASYTRRLNERLQQSTSEMLRMNGHMLEMEQKEFDAWWNESGQRPRSRELCTAPHAPVALLSARVEAPPAYSSIDSAYWPELKLRLFVCKTQQLYRQQKILSPFNADAWPFSTELNSEIEQFLRNYRSELRD